MKRGRNIFIISLILSIFGLIAIFTASWQWAYFYLNNTYYFLEHQFIYLFLGIALSFLISLFSLDFLRKTSLFLLIFCIILTYLVFVKDIGKNIRGVNRWIDLGIIQFQPAPFLAFSWILFLASFLSKKRKDLSNLHIVWILIFLSIFGIAFYYQPNMSMLILFSLATFTVLFFSNFDLKKLIPIFLLAFLVIFFLTKTANYREERIKSFSMEGKNFPLFSTYQQLQAIRIIRDGGIIGKGWGRNFYKFFLPEAYNDFIFPVILGEGGWIAGFILIALYSLLVYNVFLFAMEEKNIFNYLLLTGIISFWCWQILLNIFMSLGFLPVMGLPLPFVSFGGSSLISNWMKVGLILKISSQRG
ncbi:MAG: FtsW/RodA/SpoVE family cell cycle protein [Dictyoglomaceae bacterium]